MVEIDFRKFLRVARVNGLPLVPMDSGESGQRRSGFPQVAKQPTHGMAVGRLVAADLGFPQVA